MKMTSKTFWTPTRIGLTIGALILVVGVVSTTLPWSTSNEPAGGREISTPKSRNATPRELEAETREAPFDLLNGKARTLSDYAGSILIINLWATWCGPCRQEIPHLVEIAEEYRSRGVKILGLTTEDPDEDLERVRDFAEQFSINYEIGWATMPLIQEITKGRNGIPQALIVDQEGVVRKHYVGFHPRFSAPQMKSALDELLAKGPVSVESAP
jgi:thiol-disulfide isomerase/thioredoxin